MGGRHFPYAEGLQAQSRRRANLNEAERQRALDGLRLRLAGQIVDRAIEMLADRMKSGLKFAYYHYGPYSRDLDVAVDAAKAFASVREVVRHRIFDGAPFSAFILAPDNQRCPNGHLGELSTPDAVSYIASMKDVSSTVIELAATIHWLVHDEAVEDWRTELRKREGAKTEGCRTEQALSLLRKLNLSGAITV